MADVPTLLPPFTSPTVRQIEQATARIGDVGLPLADMWRADLCPVEFLPWLAWGLSIDFWDPDWTEVQKRNAIAATLALQMRKGTPASLRAVLDRFDPLINLVEWFDANPRLDPHTIMLELPSPDDSAVVYDQALITALLRDIAQVKPVRVHMKAVHRLIASAGLWLEGAAWLATFIRVEGVADETAEPEWFDYLQTETGEPITAPDGTFLETS